MTGVSVSVSASAQTTEQALRDIHAATAPTSAKPEAEPEGLPLPGWILPEPPPQPSVQPGSSGRVLVVDDEAHGSYRTILAAISAASDGDTVCVMPTTPREPFEVTKILRIVGDRVAWDFSDFLSSGLAQRGKGAIVVSSPACEIEGFTLSGVGLDRRQANLAAAIRNEADGWLTIRRCNIHDCQNGITSSTRNAVIEIIDTSLWRNGLNWVDGNDIQHGGVGHTHNLYVNAINTLMLRNVTATDPTDGHAIKTRGFRLVVEGGTFEAARGRCFDICNGGEFTITGTVLRKPQGASNAIVLAYAAENTESGVSDDNLLERCTLELLRHYNAMLTQAGTTTLAADCVWIGRPLSVTGGGVVVGLPALGQEQ